MQRGGIIVLEINRPTVVILCDASTRDA